jgi:hypothetical protein
MEKIMERNSVPNMQTITALLSFISAVGVIFIGYMFVKLQAEVERLDQKIKHEEIMFEIKKFEASQRQEKNKLIIKYIPKLIYGGEKVKKELLDVLSVLYPNDAENIMRNIDNTLKQKKVGLEEKEAGAVTNKKVTVKKDTNDTPKWGIAVGSDKSIEAAEYEVLRAKDQNYSPMIYKKGRRYVTIIGPFSNWWKADRVTKRVQKKLNETSYIINYHKWCGQQVSKDHYVECKMKTGA